MGAYLHLELCRETNKILRARITSDQMPSMLSNNKWFPLFGITEGNFNVASSKMLQHLKTTNEFDWVIPFLASWEKRWLGK